MYTTQYPCTLKKPSMSHMALGCLRWPPASYLALVESRSPSKPSSHNNCKGRVSIKVSKTPHLRLIECWDIRLFDSIDDCCTLTDPREIQPWSSDARWTYTGWAKWKLSLKKIRVEGKSEIRNTRRELNTKVNKNNRKQEYEEKKGKERENTSRSKGEKKNTGLDVYVWITR